MPRPRPDLPKPRHIVSLDLGQTQDFSALAVLETMDGKHAIRHLQRWKLGSKYTQIVKDVCNLVQRPPLTCPPLIVDATGVGRAVVDVFRDADLWADLKPVTITPGMHETFTDGYYRVPKKELVGALQVCLQTGRLQFAQGLTELKALVKELQTFQVKVTAAANETFEAMWRDGGAHDDLVLAVALACWWAERTGDRDVGEPMILGHIPNTTGW